MASFAAENTQDNVFLLLRSKDTFMEFRIEGNKSREYSNAEKTRHKITLAYLNPGANFELQMEFSGLASTLPAGKFYY